MACDGSSISEAHSGLAEYASLALPPDPGGNGHRAGKSWKELYPEFFARRRKPRPTFVIAGSGANEHGRRRRDRAVRGSDPLVTAPLSRHRDSVLHVAELGELHAEHGPPDGAGAALPDPVYRRGPPSSTSPPVTATVSRSSHGTATLRPPSLPLGAAARAAARRRRSDRARYRAASAPGARQPLHHRLGGRDPDPLPARTHVSGEAQRSSSMTRCEPLGHVRRCGGRRPHRWAAALPQPALRPGESGSAEPTFAGAPRARRPACRGSHGRGRGWWPWTPKSHRAAVGRAWRARAGSERDRGPSHLGPSGARRMARSRCGYRPAGLS